MRTGLGIDTHRFADDPFDDDGPDHSLLGDDQRAWLKDGIRASDANLLVVTRRTAPDLGYVGDVHEPPGQIGMLV